MIAERKRSKLGKSNLDPRSHPADLFEGGFFAFGFVCFDLATSDVSTTSFSRISPPATEGTRQFMFQDFCVIVLPMQCFPVLMQAVRNSNRIPETPGFLPKTLHRLQAFRVTDPPGRSVDAGLPGPGTAQWQQVASAEHRTETAQPVALGFSSSCFVAGNASADTLRLEICAKCYRDP